MLLNITHHWYLMPESHISSLDFLALFIISAAYLRQDSSSARAEEQNTWRRRFDLRTPSYSLRNFKVEDGNYPNL